MAAPHLGPPEIIQALETLESANAPTDLGSAYSVLLHWKPPRENFKVRIGPFRSAALLPAAFWPLTIISHQSEWIQGFACAAALLAVSRFLELLLGPLFPRPNPLRSRIRVALDKWRHLVPLMTEIAK